MCSGGLWFVAEMFVCLWPVAEILSVRHALLQDAFAQGSWGTKASTVGKECRGVETLGWFRMMMMMMVVVVMMTVTMIRRKLADLQGWKVELESQRAKHDDEDWHR